jgi:hypothetical protein
MSFIKSEYFEYPKNETEVLIFNEININPKPFIGYVLKTANFDAYLAFMSVLAYRKAPSVLKLEGFERAFTIEGSSPLPININSSTANVLKSAILLANSKQNMLVKIGHKISNKTSIPSNTKADKFVLDKIMEQVTVSISTEVLQRYDLIASDKARFKVKSFFPKTFTDDYKELINYKMTVTIYSEKNIKNIWKALYILEEAGFPVEHMGFKGRVHGL